jgi:hypothetical protein
MAYDNQIQDMILKPLRKKLLELFAKEAMKITFDEKFARHGEQWLNIKPIEKNQVGESSRCFTYDYELDCKLYTMNQTVTDLEMSNASMMMAERLENYMHTIRHDDTDWIKLTVNRVGYDDGLTDDEAELNGLSIRLIQVTIRRTETIG